MPPRSPLQRTQSTCSYILSNGHTAVAPNFLNFLIEIDYGPDENKPENDVIDRIGKKAIKLWDTSGTPPQGWLVEPDQIISSWKLFLKNISDTNDDILVVTSNGIARFLFEAVDNIEIDIHRKLDTACFGLVNVDQDITSLKFWNRKCIR